MLLRRYTLEKYRRRPIFLSIIFGLLFVFLGNYESGSQTLSELENISKEEKKILSKKEYDLYLDSLTELYFTENEINGKDIDDSELEGAGKIAGKHVLFSVIKAAKIGLIHPYAYIWNPEDKQYEIRNAFDPTGYLPIEPWQGFWIQAKEDINIWIRPRRFPPPAPPTMTFTMSYYNYYHISIPLIPVSGDVEDNFGSVLGPGEYESTWRFSKWHYQLAYYERYNGPDTIPELIPGRGFWAVQINSSQQVITLEGSAYPIHTFCRLKVPADGGALKPINPIISKVTVNSRTSNPATPAALKIPAAHMTGNPFHYDIRWWSVWVEQGVDESLPLAKIAAEDVSVFDNLDFC